MTPPLRVLVVEPHPLHRAIACRLLAREGHDATAARDEAEARDAMATTTFDVLLVDVALPGLDALGGFRSAGPPPRIVGLVAGANARDVRLDACVRKPVRASELLEAVTGSPAPHATSAVDLDEALRRAGGDASLLREVIGIFSATVPASRRALHDALAAGDAAGLQKAAHSLKGMVANFGAGTAVDAARRLEQAARDGDIEAAATELAGLDAQLREVELALEPVGAAP